MKQVRKCHCDHCTSSTCTLDNGGLCYIEAQLDEYGGVKKKYNCLKKTGLKFFNNVLCEPKNESNRDAPFPKIRVCCDDSDFCNQNNSLLPPDEQIIDTLINRPRIRELRGIMVRDLSINQQSNPLRLMSGLQMSLYLLSLFAFVGILLFIQQQVLEYSRRRRRNRRVTATRIDIESISPLVESSRQNGDQGQGPSMEIADLNASRDKSSIKSGSSGGRVPGTGQATRSGKSKTTTNGSSRASSSGSSSGKPGSSSKSGRGSGGDDDNNKTPEKTPIDAKQTKPDTPETQSLSSRSLPLFNDSSTEPLILQVNRQKTKSASPYEVKSAKKKLKRHITFKEEVAKERAKASKETAPEQTAPKEVKSKKRKPKESKSKEKEKAPAEETVPKEVAATVQEVPQVPAPTTEAILDISHGSSQSLPSMFHVETHGDPDAMLSRDNDGSDDDSSGRDRTTQSSKHIFFLTKRSISNDIELSREVGKGRYAIVKQGVYKGEPVAVKIFTPAAESSWKRESELYQTSLLRHKNLLGFIASDACLSGNQVSSPGYWLVTEYYPLGSLYDFLNDNHIVIEDAYRMAFSIANGLAHLHTEIGSSRVSLGKPAIAHRDFKSKNILVKQDGTCCIGDLGLAVRYYSANNQVDVPTTTRVGTKRYLAPEMLDKSLNLSDFESIKACDIYALGLVLWEMLRRASIGPPNHMAQRIYDGMSPYATMDPLRMSVNDIAGVYDTYKAPYEDYVSNQPTTDEMVSVVCIRKIRPPISTRWTHFASSHDYMRLMQECWYEKPKARLTAIGARKTLSILGKHHFPLSEMEYE